MLDQEKDDLDPEIFEMLKQQGLIPGTDEEVEIAEQLIATSPTPLPASLQDTAAVFQRIIGHREVVPLKSVANIVIEQDMARAAREGGMISKVRDMDFESNY